MYEVPPLCVSSGVLYMLQCLAGLPRTQDNLLSGQEGRSGTREAMLGPSKIHMLQLRQSDVDEDVS